MKYLKCKTEQFKDMNVIRGITTGGTSFLMTDSLPAEGWAEMSESEIESVFPREQSAQNPPEIGPLLMDITLKQAELEMKLDAIGTMLVPTLPEV